MTASPASALRPWIIVAALLPVLAFVAWAAGLFDAPPPAPIADRNVAALERAPMPSPDGVARRDKGEPPRVVFLGDSRYLKALRGVSMNTPSLRPRKVMAGGVPLEMLSYFTRAGASIADLDRFVPKILAWKPDVVVLQPELLVEETSLRGLAPAAVSERRRLENWKARIDLWADKVELPKAGRALPAAMALAERLRREGIRVLVAQIPPSETVMKAVPAGYYETMRALVCTVLVSCEEDYLTFAASYPDAYFRDPLHLSNEGREVFYPRLMEAVARALRAGPTTR